MKRSLSELSPRQRNLVVLAAAAELTLKLAALRDISRRSPEEIRGTKTPWRLAQIVNTFGPLGYFLFGRRSTPTPAKGS
jgi:hypothetical protein